MTQRHWVHLCAPALHYHFSLVLGQWLSLGTIHPYSTYPFFRIFDPLLPERNFCDIIHLLILRPPPSPSVRSCLWMAPYGCLNTGHIITFYLFIYYLFIYLFLFFNILFSFIYIIHIIHVQNITATRHWLFTSHHKICTLRLTFYHICTYHNSLFIAQYICA